MDFHTILQKQKDFFASGKTLSLDFRLEQLKKLRRLIKDNEQLIFDALRQDLGRAPEETFLIENSVTLEELDYVIAHLRKWAKPKRASTPFPLLFPGKSRIYYEPYGCALIISPWNYPVFLNFSPLVGAMCAGNCVIVKPSEMATASEKVITNLLNDNFPPEYICAVDATANEMNDLLAQKFDYIFFTGGTNIGKIIMAAAAKNLTPITLELGGKSPCIVDASTNVNFAAKRIMWGKMTNAGQTCIAPDYVYVHVAVKDAFIAACKKALIQFFGNDPATSKSYDRIINQKHFDRLSKLMQQGKTIVGGQTNADELYISPTLIDNVGWQDPIMQEEIFGPLCPILTFTSIDALIKTINAQPKPLALYIFSDDKSNTQQIIERVSFGGGCINDVLMHVANHYLPFGGVGNSGMGAYHGEFSFETFSHKKGIYQRTPKIALGLEYPPFSSKKLSWLRRILRQ